MGAFMQFSIVSSQIHYDSCTFICEDTSPWNILYAVARFCLTWYAEVEVDPAKIRDFVFGSVSRYTHPLISRPEHIIGFIFTAPSAVAVVDEWTNKPLLTIRCPALYAHPWTLLCGIFTLLMPVLC